MKKGLVLEGGAMRGLFTAGVMDVLMENKVEFDGVIGVSAGAAFGANYKSGQIGRVLRYNTKYGSDKRYCGLRVLLKTGNLFSTEFCYGEVPLKLDPFDFEAYAKNPSEFYVVCTDVETGKPVYHRYKGWEDHGFDWIRASASMPLVSKIVDIDGQKLLDGGMSDSIPVAYFESIGYDRNVAVLTQPDGYRKQPNRAMKPIKLRYGKYPCFVKATEKRHLMYNKQLDYVKSKEKSGELLVIRPKAPLNIARAETNPDELRRVYDLGRAAAQEKLEAVQAFLKNA